MRSETPVISGATVRRFYDLLPIGLQNAACSVAGYRRVRDRYNPVFHETLDRWQASIAGPVEALHEIQRERLARLVERARRYTGYYRDIPPASQAKDPAQAIEETLAGIPVLEKTDYRDRAEDFIASDIPRSRIRKAVTSGTTATSLHVFHTPQALAEEYATVWRMRTARGVLLDDPHMTFGGQIIVPFRQARPPYWRSNRYGRQLIFSLYHMSSENLVHYVDQIQESDAAYAHGYPSALHLVATAMLEMGKPLPRGRLKAIFTSSESLLAYQRETIEAAFGAEVWDRYGTAEFAVSMTACGERNLHVDMEFCIVEVEPQEETDEYVRGHLLVTGLGNDATPFIRYRIGDVATRLKKPCPCGRPGDAFLDVDGRVEDFVKTPDGRLVGRLDHIFKHLDPIREAQIRQDSQDAIAVLYVPGDGFDEAAEDLLVSEIRARLGDAIRIDLRPVSAIPREANGKFRAVKSTFRHHFG